MDAGTSDHGLNFYGNLLGLKYAGASMNHGTEREHLNNVARAHPAGHGLQVTER